jgi:hypothetical protein
VKRLAMRGTDHPKQIDAIFRLDTPFGTSWTHALIALARARHTLPVRRGERRPVSRRLLAAPVRVAAFDGENTDPSNGNRLGNTPRACTPWGELAYAKH